MLPVARGWLICLFKRQTSNRSRCGNTPAIIDDSADVILAVNSIIHSKTFDNGMICASEQSVIVLDKVYKEVKDEFKKRAAISLINQS